MKRQYTFLIASNTGYTVKQTTISNNLLILFGFMSVVFFLVLGFILLDYGKLKNTSFHTYLLESRAQSQQNEIADQRKQIQIFANEINSLKTTLVNLNQFEKKIRIVANIEKANEQDTIFGVGGSMPEDLNTSISLKKQHSGLIRKMHEQMEELTQATDRQKEGLESLLKSLEDQRSLLASTPAICPTEGWVTSRFGYRISPFTGQREFHKGLDIATRSGTPVEVSADGVITFVGEKGFLGKAVTVDHGHGIVTRYGHLLKTIVKSGDRVKRGDKIALVGSSGRSTGPHLHYEVRVNGVQVNPEKYIID